MLISGFKHFDWSAPNELLDGIYKVYEIGEHSCKRDAKTIEEYKEKKQGK